MLRLLLILTMLWTLSMRSYSMSNRPDLGTTPKKYFGKEAVVRAAEFYGVPLAEVTPEARLIIEEEGFAKETYLDTKLIPTQGVGLTGELIGKDFFKDALPIYLNRARAVTPEYDELPRDKRLAILSAVYRGDLSPKHRTAELMREGKWKEAAKEYLNHGDYMKAKAENQKAGRIANGVQTRMERNAAAFGRE
jgi:hypothetical protein